MYIAGLQLNPSHEQGIESIVCGSLFVTIISAIRTQGRGIAKAAEAGPIKKSGLPTSLLGRVVSPIHSAAYILPPVSYLASVTLNRFVQPEWIRGWRLPLDVSIGTEAGIRTAACALTPVMIWFGNTIFKHLGAQWHYIGVRERPKIVNTGPYAYVRHPLYSLVLVQTLLWATMFWNTIPLYSFGIMAASFAVKMPIEEQLMLDDKDIGPDYAVYKTHVRSRVIPYIW